MASGGTRRWSTSNSVQRGPTFSKSLSELLQKKMVRLLDFKAQYSLKRQLSSHVEVQTALGTGAGSWTVWEPKLWGHGVCNISILQLEPVEARGLDKVDRHLCSAAWKLQIKLTIRWYIIYISHTTREEWGPAAAFGTAGENLTQHRQAWRPDLKSNPLNILNDLSQTMLVKTHKLSLLLTGFGCGEVWSKQCWPLRNSWPWAVKACAIDTCFSQGRKPRLWEILKN